MRLSKGIYILILLISFGSILCKQPSETTINQENSLRTLHQIDDFPLFTMNYEGDYGFDAFLLEGISALILKPKGSKSFWGCTCFGVLNEQNQLLMGRNFDWYDHAALLLYTDPPDAYKSVSLVDISYLGYDKHSSSFFDEARLLEAPFYPFDGMNEYGLCVGMMAVPYAQQPFDAKKVTIGSLHVIRLLLDYAKDLETALSLMQKYNIDFSGGPPLHYFIADANGKSAVVEFVDNQMVVLKSTDIFQVSTNFLISQMNPGEQTSSCWRYNLASQMLNTMNSSISGSSCMQILEQVAQNNTIWSVVYNTATTSLDIVMGKKYSQVHHFTLE